MGCSPRWRLCLRRQKEEGWEDPCWGGAGKPIRKRDTPLPPPCPTPGSSPRPAWDHGPTGPPAQAWLHWTTRLPAFVRHPNCWTKGGERGRSHPEACPLPSQLSASDSEAPSGVKGDLLSACSWGKNPGIFPARILPRKLFSVGGIVVSRREAALGGNWAGSAVRTTSVQLFCGHWGAWAWGRGTGGNSLGRVAGSSLGEAEASCPVLP